jgi:gliding motility-associated-like protein
MGDIMAPGHCISTASTFTITVYPTARHTQSYSLCPGGSITVGNKVHNITGIYIDTLVNASVHGCDSIVTTNLIVKSYPTFYQAISFCGAGSVTIGNALHNTAGYYIDTLYNAGANGCDSIVYTNLSIGAVPAAAPTETSSAVCPGTTIPSNVLGPAGLGIGYLWTGSTTSIGLADGGQYTVPSFVSANTSSSNIIDTIIVRLTAGGYAYVVNTNFASVSVIDRQSALVVGTISVGNSPEGIAISPDGSLAYVTNSGDNTVSVISTASQSVVTLIHVGNNPQGICVSPDGSRVYVANYSGANVFVINTGTNTVVDTIAVGNNPLGISATPDGKQVYVANYGDNTVSVISTAGNNVSALIHVGANPYGVSVSPPGNLTYVTNLTSGTVSVISTVNNVVTDTVIVGSGPKGIAVSPDGSRVYVANSVSDNVSVIYAHNDSVSNPIGVGTRPNGISVSADGTRAYVANALSGSMSVINTTANTVSNNITGLPGPNSFGNFVTGSGCTGPASSYTITVYPTTHTQNYSFCVTGSVTVGAHTYTSTGTYIDTLPGASAHGCDSIIITNLNIYPVATFTQSVAICGGSTYTFNGHVLTATGTYMDTFVNAAVTGCDSIVTTNLYVNPLSAYTQYDTICQGSSFTENGHAYTSTGTYTDTFINASVTGCDSIVTTNLYAYPQATYTQYDTICRGHSFTENGHIYTANGTYMDTFTNASIYGCDSIVTTNLYVTPPPTYTQYDTICQGSSFVENGHNYTSTGTYMDTLANASIFGCDSIVTTNLYAYPLATYTQYDTICQGGSFTENGHIYTATGTYMDTFVNASIHGCDSIVTTNLTVNQPSAYTQYDTICQGSSFVENGHTYTSVGTYMDTFTNASVTGCDSIVTTNLYVNPLSAYTQFDTICQGGSFTENGHSYTSTGTYMDTFYNGSVTHCDSIVTTNLYVYPLATYTQFDTICHGGSFVENGHIYTSAGTYMDTFTNGSVTGCDSIVTTHLFVNPLSAYTQYDTICQNGSFTENGHNYTSTGTYMDTFYNASVTHCDSIVTTNLYVYPLATYTQFDTICQGSSFLENGHSYTSTGTYIDTFYNASVTGCDSIVTTNLFVAPLPIVNLGPNVTMCGGNIKVDAGNTGSTFIWSDGTTTEIDTISTSGMYTVTVINTFGCTATGSKTVYIKSPPVVNLGPTQNICGDSTILDAGNPGNTYMWTGGSTGEFLTVYSSGLYTVTVTDTATLCSTSDSVQVNINNAPTVSLGDDTSLCGGPYTITASGSPATYLWSNNATTSSITVSTTGNYSVTATSAAGCTASASVLVTIYPQPNLGPDIVDSICPGSTVNLYNYFINSGLALTYSTPNPASVDTGVYWIVGTNSNGCSDSVMVTITQRQKPNLGGNQTDSVCAGYTINLTKLYPDAGYTTYTWNVANDTAVGPGVYQLIVTNASGCSDTATVTVTQRAKPIVTIPTYPNQCSTNPDFVLTGATPAGGTYYINYVEDSLFSPSTLGAGSYRILYIYTNASGCTDSASTNITVWPQPQIIDTTILPTSCTGSPLIDLSTYFSPAGGVFTGPGVSGVYFYPSLAPVGSDSITYIYTDRNGCMDTAGRRIDIIPSVKVTLHTDQSNLTICQGQSITFIASGAVDYQFFVNDSPVTTLSTEDTFTTSGLSNHDQIMVYGTNGCSSDSSDFIIVDVNPLPTVIVGPDTTIALGQTVQLYSYTTGATPLVYLWTPDSSLNLTNIPNPVYSGQDTIIFQLMVTDANGCSAVAHDTINVYVTDNVLLPNFITPNGDGINDAWTLNDKIDLAGSHLVIFNRWGEVVYETWNYNNDWKGTYQSSGKTVPDGTYYYVLTVPTQNHTYKGPINVFDSNGN